MVDAPKAEQQVEPAPAPEAAPQTETQQLLAIFREHVQPILIGLGIALAVILAYGAFKNFKQSTAMRASQMLMSSRNAEQLQQVIQQYPSSPSAPIAMLTLASEYFKAAQYDQAQAVYAQFRQKFPKHPMTLMADLGKAQCLEASGQLDQALSMYEAFVVANPAHFLAPSAIFGKGRCLAQMGRFAEAKAVYEDFIAANPNSAWNTQADSAMLFVDKELRAHQKKQGGEGSAKEPAISAVSAAPAVSVPVTSAPTTPSESAAAR